MFLIIIIISVYFTHVSVQSFCTYSFGSNDTRNQSNASIFHIMYNTITSLILQYFMLINLFLIKPILLFICSLKIKFIFSILELHIIHIYSNFFYNKSWKRVFITQSEYFSILIFRKMHNFKPRT